MHKYLMDTDKNKIKKYLLMLPTHEVPAPSTVFPAAQEVQVPRWLFAQVRQSVPVQAQKKIKILIIIKT